MPERERGERARGGADGVRAGAAGRGGAVRAHGAQPGARDLRPRGRQEGAAAAARGRRRQVRRGRTPGRGYGLRGSGDHYLLPIPFGLRFYR